MYIQISYLRLWTKKHIRDPAVTLLELLGGPAVFLLFVLLVLPTFHVTLIPKGHQFTALIRPQLNPYAETLCSIRGVGIVPDKGQMVRFMKQRLQKMGCLIYLFQNSTQLNDFTQRQKTENELMGAVEFIQAQSSAVQYRLRLDPTTHLLNRPGESLSARTFNKQLILLQVQSLIDNSIFEFLGGDFQIQHNITSVPSTRDVFYSNLFQKLGEFIDIVPVLSLFLTFSRVTATFQQAFQQNLINLCMAKSGRLHFNLSVVVWSVIAMGVQSILNIGVYKVLQPRVEMLNLAAIFLVGILNIAIEALAVAHVLARFSVGPLLSFLAFLGLYLPMNISRNRTTLLRPLLLALGPSGLGLTLNRYLLVVSMDEEERGMPEVWWQLVWLLAKAAVGIYLNIQQRYKAKSQTVIINRLRVNFETGSSLDLQDLSFHVGQLVSVAGHNGAGKSTFMRVLAGSLTPHFLQGQILGLTVQRASHMISFLQQRSYSFSYLTVQQNLEFIAGISGMPHMAGLYGELMKLKQFKNLRSQNLSAGQARRLQLAMRVMGDEKIWLLDEPLNKVDEESSLIIKRFIKEQSEERLIFVSSHNKLHFEGLADAQVILNSERLPSKTHLPSCQPISGLRLLLLQLRSLVGGELSQMDFQGSVLELLIPVGVLIGCLLLKSLKIHENYQPDDISAKIIQFCGNPCINQDSLFLYQFQALKSTVNILVSDIQVGSLRQALSAADRLLFQQQLAVHLAMQYFPLHINYRGSITNNLNGCLISFLLLMAINFQVTGFFRNYCKNFNFSKLLFRTGLSPVLYFSTTLMLALLRVLFLTLAFSAFSLNDAIKVSLLDLIQLSLLVVMNLVLTTFVMQEHDEEKAIVFFGYNFISGDILPVLLLVLLLYWKNSQSLLYASKAFFLLPNFAYGVGTILCSAALYLKTFNNLSVDCGQLLRECKQGMVLSCVVLVVRLVLIRLRHDRYEETVRQLEPETSRDFCSEELLLQFRDLQVIYKSCFRKDFASQRICGAIPEGQTIWLCGANGVGKSSVLRVLANQPLKFEGWIGRSIAVEEMGLAKQYNQLPLQLSIEVILEITCLARKLPYSRRQIQEAISSFGLHKYRSSPLRQLSGGFLKKANLLVAMLGTRVWLLDEPLEQLDEESQDQILRVVEGSSVVMVSHHGQIVEGTRIEMA